MATIEKYTSQKNNKSQEQNTPKFISRDEARFSIGIGDKNFGTVSYGAYRAVENNTLDSYAPINEEEKSVLEAYKKQAESYAFKTKYGDTIMSRIIQDGDKSIVVPGYYDGAILSQEQAEQRYKATGEHFGKFNTSDEAISYANRLNTGGLSALGVRKAKEIEPPKVTDYAKYAAGRAAGGFTGALIKPVELAGIAGNKTASFITSLGGLMPNKVSKFYDQEVKGILNKEWALTEQYHNNMDLHERKYALESDKKNFVGGLAESAGSVAGVFAFGGLGKFGSAANGANAAKNMTTTALKAQANATKLTKSMNMVKNGLKSFFTPQDVLFGSTAAMSSAQEVSLLKRTPFSSSTSYRVTLGPRVTLMIWASILKLARVSFSLREFSRISSVPSAPPFAGFFSKSMGGKQYSGCFCVCASAISCATC